MELVCACARGLVDHRTGHAAKFSTVVAGGDVDLLHQFRSGQVDAQAEEGVRIVNSVDNRIVCRIVLAIGIEERGALRIFDLGEALLRWSDACSEACKTLNVAGFHRYVGDLSCCQVDCYFYAFGLQWRWGRRYHDRLRSVSRSKNGVEPGNR